MVQFGVMTDSKQHTSWLYNHPESTQSFKQNNVELQEALDAADLMVCHNAKFELIWMLAMGLKPPKHVWCTQVAQFVLEGQRRGPKGYYSLNGVADRYGLPGKFDKVSLYWDSGYETDEVPANVLVPYNAQDNEVAGSVYCRQVPALIAQPNLSVTMRMQMGLIPLLAEIEWNGMLVHQELLEELNVEYTAKVKDYNAELEDIAGERINWGSKPQVSAILFGGSYKVESHEDYLFYYKGHPEMGAWKNRKVNTDIVVAGMGFDPPDRSETATPGVYSVKENVIKSLKPRNKKQRRFLQILMERSKAEKLRSTYFEGLQEKIVGGCVHPKMNQTVARNARLTSSDPNGQNMPRGTTGPVKSVFISRYD